ncbi:MAG: hypothetical protein K8R90_11270 [Candidatus Cloacimonetes bacterium]|nr:hypothetical protein [Candidatus Cloacimonadota bacterium]MCD4829999.1 hypothetical protein [Candidatus Cloacimonadota bacterium]
MYQRTPWDGYSDQNVKVTISENGQYVLWEDRGGNEINRMPCSPHYRTAYPFGNGNYWLIEEQGWVDEGFYDRVYPGGTYPTDGYLIDSYFPHCHGIIVTDAYGNKLFERVLQSPLKHFKPGPSGRVIWLVGGGESQFITIDNQVIYKLPRGGGVECQSPSLLPRMSPLSAGRVTLSSISLPAKY